MCLACVILPLSAADYRFADDSPGPDPWIYPESDPTPVASDGVRYLGVADHVELGGARPAWHRRLSYEVVEERGLASAGQFSIGYQPAYQTVVVHAIDVWRAGQRLDRRRQSRIEVLRRETGLEQGLIDGGRSLSVTIPDIRVGDRIEYRYTVHGYNPVFGRGYHDYWTTRYSVPVGARVVRIDYPEGMALALPSAPSGFAARAGTQPGGRWWELRGTGLPKLDEEDGTPVSYGDSHQIEVSTAGNWRDVVEWARPLYPGRFTDRALAADLVQRLRLDRADPAGSSMRAIAFVQGEVRYTGLDMGLKSHAPNTPELVAERRFGDCKDKTQLLIALLHEAGVSAAPVLVNTRLGEAIANRMPSPLAFDHVVVKVELPDGAVWVDPTRERERGPLTGRAPLGFGLGLAIAPGSERLQQVPAPFPSTPEIDVAQRLDFSMAGNKLEARFDVRTSYQRGHAEGIRNDFAGDGAGEIGKRYLAYMQNYYENLRLSGDPVLADGEQELEVRETYALEWDGKSDGTVFGIIPFQVLDWVPSLADQVRRTPWSLRGPRYGRHVVRSYHPDGWSIPDSEDVIENPYFQLRRRIEVEQGSVLVITAEWKRLANDVPAEDFVRVRKDLRKARDLLQYDVDLDAGWPMPSLSPRDWAWPAVALLATVLVLVGLWWARDRWVLAGMLYRPRGTVATRLSANGLAVGGTLGFATVLVELAFERGGAMIVNPSAFAVGALIGGFIVLCLRWAFFSAMLQLALWLFGHRVSYRDVRLAYGMALAPMLVFILLAMLALGFRVHWLDDHQIGDPSRAPAQFMAFALLMMGISWWLVSLAGACAGVSGARRYKGVLVVAVSVLPLLCAAMAFVIFFLPG